MLIVLSAALLYVASGLAVLPIKPDGSKAPAVKEWKPYQSKPPSQADVEEWFKNDYGYGIAIICGKASGGLEVLDCDKPELFPSWRELVESLCPSLLARLVIIKTPSRGFHVYYRCSDTESNQKLAQLLEDVPEGEKGARCINGRWVKIVTALETRGEGGYTIALPSPPECHPDNQPYTLLQGDLTAIPIITAEERAVMLDAARSFNEYVRPEKVFVQETQQRQSGIDARPGTDFNNRGDLAALLTSHGWKCMGRSPLGTRWQRPGGNRPSATLFNTSGMLYVFSTRAAPFFPDCCYSPFSVYALLEHGGDFHLAAQALAAQGYGERNTASRILVSRPPRLFALSRSFQTIKLHRPIKPAHTEQLQRPAQPALTRKLQMEADCEIQSTH